MLFDQRIKVALLFHYLLEDFCLQVIDQVVGVVQLVVNILREAAPLKHQLDARVKFHRLYLLDGVELRPASILRFLFKSCTLEEGLEGSHHVHLIFTHLCLLILFTKVAARISLIPHLRQYVLAHLLKFVV